MSDCGISAKTIVARVESVPAPNSSYLGCRWQESRLQLTQCCLRAANNTKTETCCHGDLSRCFCGDSASFASIRRRFSLGKTDQVLKVTVMLLKGDLFFLLMFLMFFARTAFKCESECNFNAKALKFSQTPCNRNNLHSLLALESPPSEAFCVCAVFYSALYSRRSCSCFPPTVAFTPRCSRHHYLAWLLNIIGTVSKVSAADLMLCGSAVIWPQRVATRRPVSS